MANSGEEFDNDERPAPPKRQCTSFVKVNETAREQSKSPCSKEESIQDSESLENEEAEKCKGEMLKAWQMSQVAKGFVQNTINGVLEGYNMGAPPSYVNELICNELSGDDMEETAVLMAIFNYGLAPSKEHIPHLHYSYPPNSIQGNFASSVASTSKNSIRLNNASNIDCNRHNGDLDKVDDNDQQENFLERAVAEAIKKKGLTTLSIDYK